jgi:hypothetical protein
MVKRHKTSRKRVIQEIFETDRSDINQSRRLSHFPGIPDDIWREIFSFLQTKEDFHSIMRVCRQTYQLNWKSILENIKFRFRYNVSDAKQLFTANLSYVSSLKFKIPIDLDADIYLKPEDMEYLKHIPTLKFFSPLPTGECFCTLMKDNKTLRKLEVGPSTLDCKEFTGDIFYYNTLIKGRRVMTPNTCQALESVKILKIGCDMDVRDLVHFK